MKVRFKDTDDKGRHDGEFNKDTMGCAEAEGIDVGVDTISKVL